MVRPFHGFSALAGSAALALLATPVVTRTTEDIMRLQSAALREAGMALGADKGKVIRAIIWRSSKSGLVTGGLLGFAVALGSSYGPRWSRLLVSLYIKLIQGTPLLVLLPLAYFGLPALGLNVAPLTAAALALSIYVSAYLGEIWRGCIESVPRTQAEAAECLALRWHQRVWHVILPQAIKIATPSTVGFMVQIVKNTSLGMAIGLAELSYRARQVEAETFQSFQVYGLTTLLYIVLIIGLELLSQHLGQRRRWGQAVLRRA
jgi:polar amino acid transport system permease protein